MENKLVLSWRNPVNRTWVSVGILEHKDEKFYFNYTNGAKDNDFIAFSQMNELNKTYVSEELFPLFKNRLLSKTRPEYEDFISWLNIDKNDSHDLKELSRSRGIRATDNLQLFPYPEKDLYGNYEVLFFSHGVSHIAKHYVKRLLELKVNDKLLIFKDIKNESDSLALGLRTNEDPVELLGYCPSFFVSDFNKLLELNGATEVNISVEKVNFDAPVQMKLLCKLKTRWPKNFEPFENDEFKKIL